MLLRHGQVWLLGDDIYEHLVYDDFEFVTPAMLEPRPEEPLPDHERGREGLRHDRRIGYAAGRPS